MLILSRIPLSSVCVYMLPCSYDSSVYWFLFQTRVTAHCFTRLTSFTYAQDDDFIYNYQLIGCLEFLGTIKFGC